VAACVLNTTGVFAGAYLKPGGGGGKELLELVRELLYELDLVDGGELTGEVGAE